jgi:hypothetical protein
MHMAATQDFQLPFAIAGWTLRTVMGKYGPLKRMLHIAAFPDELMHIIFSKLEFRDKVNAGLVCKEWDNLLKTCTGAARHWDIKYVVKRIVASPVAEKQHFTSADSTASVARWAEHLYPFLTVNTRTPAGSKMSRDPHWSLFVLSEVLQLCHSSAAVYPCVKHYSYRWFASHAAAIKHVHLSAPLSMAEDVPSPTLECLAGQLPLLAGAVSTHVDSLGLTLRGKPTPVHIVSPMTLEFLSVVMSLFAPFDC